MTFRTSRTLGAWAAVAATLATSATILAQVAPAGLNRSLSLKECIDLALEQNLGVRISKLGPEISLYELRAGYGAYDPTFNLKASRTFTDQPSIYDPKKLSRIVPPFVAPPLSYAAGVDSPYLLTTDSGGPSLDGKLPFGLGYSLFTRVDRFDSTTSVPDALLPFYNSAVPINSVSTNTVLTTAGISLSQPLLKNFLIDASRRDIQLAKLNLKASEYQLKQKLISTITAVHESYYNLVAAREAVKLQEQQVARAEELLKYVRTKITAHAMIELEGTRAEANLEAVKTALFRARQTFVENQNQLKRLVSADFARDADADLQPADTLTLLPEKPSREESWKTALLNRPDLQEMKSGLEKRDVMLKFYSNQRLPSLNLVGGYGWQEVQREFGDSLGGLSDGNHAFYSAGVVLSIPLGNVKARNNYRAGKAAKEQALLDFERLQQDILSQVDTALKVHDLALQEISAAQKAREFAQLAFDAEKKRYESGGATGFELIEHQSKLATARLAELEALAHYNITKARIADAEGTTLERNNIHVKAN